MTSTTMRTSPWERSPKTTTSPVRDVIVRAEATLTELEDKTHLIRRFREQQEQLRELNALADRLRRRNDRDFRDQELDDIARSLYDLGTKLSEG